MHEYDVHTIYTGIFNSWLLPEQLLNRLVPLVTHLLIPILMVSDLQTNTAALKSKNAWLVLFVAPSVTMFTHERVYP